MKLIDKLLATAIVVFFTPVGIKYGLAGETYVAMLHVCVLTALGLIQLMMRNAAISDRLAAKQQKLLCKVNAHNMAITDELEEIKLSLYEG